MENDLRWQKLLWSFVIVAASLMVRYINYKTADQLIGFDIYPYILWPYVSGASLIVVLARVCKFLWGHSFLYILTGTINVTIGAIGIYLNITSDVHLAFYIHGMFWINIVFTSIIFWDVFKNTKPLKAD